MIKSHKNLSDRQAEGKRSLLGFSHSTKRSKSILFVSPDYHTSFAYRDELRRRDWKCQIYVPRSTPRNLLFAEDVIFEPTTWGQNIVFRAVNSLVAFFHFQIVGLRYRYHIHYGALQTPASIELLFPNSKWVSDGVHLGLAISRLLRRKIVYVPSGCRDEELKSFFLQIENGRICGNCGYSDRCDDSNIWPILQRARRYSNLNVSHGFFRQDQIESVSLPYKVIDLERWQPSEPAQQRRRTIRIVHSHSLTTRSAGGRNIKGTPHIIESMQKLAKDVPGVEFIELTGLAADQIMYEQQKADIVIDQLFYGHWGSTAIEAMALGKVVVCYLRPEWIANYRANFPDIDDIPIISATESNLYEVMHQLVLRPDEIRDVGQRARRFAERHFDPARNTDRLIKHLASI